MKPTYFRLIKDWGEWKKGKRFDCFDGLICGVYSNNLKETQRFDNLEFFKIVKQRKNDNKP